MGNGVVVGFGELVRLLVNVLEGRFYAVRTPPIRVGSAMSHEDGLQIVDRFGGEPHEKGGLVLVPIMAVFLRKDKLVLGHRLVSCRMTTVNPAEARP
jgi:hypothetical protein